MSITSTSISLPNCYALLLAGFCFLAGALLTVSDVQAQTVPISGQVTSSEDGSALPGVNVIVKGTTVGTVTDIDGNYKLNIPESAETLTFSFIGFTELDVPINGRTTIDASLTSDVKQLTEVVVTAIGIEREKKALGYSVASVSGENIAQRSEPDPLRAIQGKMPGVNIQGGGGAPGQSTKINIRGVSSLTGNTQPLFVVDGIPFDNSVNASDPTDPTGSVASGGTQFSNRAFDLDPNNIESMTVLKGAAAAALYGSRATNGVVVITTKSAKKNAKKGLEITYNGSYNIEEISSIPDYQDIYGQGSNQLYNGGFIGNWGAPFPDYVDQLNAQYGTSYSKVYVPGYPEGTVPHPLASTSYAISESQNYPALFPEFLDENGNAIAVPYQPYDIIGGYFDKGRLVENSINITAGGDKSTLTGGFSRMDNKGIIPNSESARTSLSFGGNGQLDNGLFISGNVNYVNTYQKSPQSGGSFFADYTDAVSTSIYGRLFYLPRNYNLMGYPFENPVNGNNVFYRSLDNPRWIAKYNSYTSEVNRVYGNMNLSYDIGDWLNLTAKGGVNTYSEARKDIVRQGGSSVPSGRIWTEDITYMEQDYNVIATITKDINEAFAFRGIVGFNANQRDLSRRKVTGSNLISVGLNNTDATSIQTVNYDYNRLQRFYAAYADLQFSYKDYLYLNFVGRNDWSSTLPKDNRSYFYPGVSTSFVFTEGLNISNEILNFGKVRASVTKVGNEPAPYQTLTYFNLQQPFSLSGTDYNRALLADVLGNPNLKPEFTTEYEAGIELQLLKNKIGVDATYFYRSSTDQIATARLPSTSGFEREVVNIGELVNKGWEIGLDVTPISTASGFNWNTYFSFTRIRSEVVDAGPAGEIYIGGPLSSLGTIHRTGEPYGQILGSVNARDSISGALLIDKSTGLPFALPTSEIIGNPNPDFLLGITNTFSFKGFKLRALIDWRQGGDIYSATAASLLLRGQLKVTEDREALRVVPGVYGNTQTYAAVLDDNGNAIPNTTGITAFDYHFSNGFGAYGQDEVNVYDGTVIRLREISLGYTVPKSFLEKLPFGSLSVMLSGRNLWFHAPNFLEGLNFDPEVLAEPADSNVQGFDYGAAPTTRRYGINLTATF